jgi:hypothetical protein
MNDTFNDPGSGGDQLPIDDLSGALLLVTVHEETPPIDTKFGPSTAIRADVAVLDGKHKGDVYTDTLVFPRVLKSQLRGSVGGKVLGRLGQGENKKGNPPWQLAAATDAEKETGRRYLAYMATQVPVTVPVEEEEPF